MPSAEDVETLLLFIGHGMTYENASKLLQQQGTIEAAANRFFDNPDNPLKQEDTGYDMNAFHADRYGEPNAANVPSFNIEYPAGVDNFPRSGQHSVAPSRPPSRTSHHGASPANGDDPIQSIESGQESGVLGSTSTQAVFGPANKDQHYDASSWAMVPISQSIEYIPDAVPSQRKREEEGPAIIRPLPGGDYLPPLISIIHTIPLFRNALLAPEIAQKNYTAGKDWWKGNPSAQPRIISYEPDEDSPRDLDVIYETQRLMAFLDGTDRAYASVGGLQQLEAWNTPREDLSESPNDQTLRFLMTWGDAYHKLTSKPLEGVFRSVISAEGSQLSSALLDINVIHHTQSADLTLYDVLDENLFDSVSGIGTAFIKEPSNVLILRLESSDTKGNKLNCKIPATFYADRYLEENKDAIAAMVNERKQCDAQVKEIDVEADKIKYHTTKKVRPGEKMETLKLLKSSMVAFQQKPDDLIHDPRNEAILTQLQSVYKSIERKLNVLEEQKDQVRKSLEDMSSRFKAPVIDSGDEPAKEAPVEHDTEEPSSDPLLQHPYKLCGVSTAPNVIYLLHPDAKTNDTSTQWWRIEYSTPGSDLAYILRERLSLSAVLKKASEENRSAMLVYANEEAISPELVPLPEALASFVKADNFSFYEEIQADMDYDKPSEDFEPLGGWSTEDAPPYQQGPAPYEDDSASRPNRWDVGPYYSNKEYDKAWEKTEDQDSWENISAERHFQLQQEQEAMTQSIQMEDKKGVSESQEVNGGFDAWAGVSNASSETVGGGDAMEVVHSRTEAAPTTTGTQVPQAVRQGETDRGDVEMRDVSQGGNDGAEDQLPKVQHIEVLEKKGG